jgi:hypothetical protein
MNNPIFSLSEMAEDLPLNYPSHFLGIPIPATLDFTEQETRLQPMKSVEVSHPFSHCYPVIFQTITLLHLLPMLQKKSPRTRNYEHPISDA